MLEDTDVFQKEGGGRSKKYPPKLNLFFGYLRTGINHKIAFNIQIARISIYVYTIDLEWATDIILKVNKKESISSVIVIRVEKAEKNDSSLF